MNISKTRQLVKEPFKSLQNVRLRSQGIYTFIVVAALISFEIFNYSTTDYALRDLLGSVGFGGLRWSTILALAFCGMDFAGIARIFSPDNDDSDEGSEGWLLLGAWLLAAAMNASLTWWAVSIAIYNHPVESVLVVDPIKIVTIVPIFVAIMVWVIRILIIGSLTNAVNRLQATKKKPANPQPIASKPFGFTPPVTNANFTRRPVPHPNSRLLNNNIKSNGEFHPL